MSKAKHAALGIFDVFAEENSAAVFLQTEAQGFVHCVPDPILSRRQYFLFDLWWRLRNVGEKLVRRRILRSFCVGVLAANSFLNLGIEFGEILSPDDTFLDQLILPTFERIEFFEPQQFLLRAVKLLIIRARMTREPFHRDPEEERPAAGANLLECFRRRVINQLYVLSFNLSPVVRLENIQSERICLARGHADAIGVVFDEKEQG